MTDFLSYSPSVIAAAAVMTAAGGFEQLPDAFYQRVDKVIIMTKKKLIIFKAEDSIHNNNLIIFLETGNSEKLSSTHPRVFVGFVSFH